MRMAESGHNLRQRNISPSSNCEVVSSSPGVRPIGPIDGIDAPFRVVHRVDQILHFEYRTANGATSVSNAQRMG